MNILLTNDDGIYAEGIEAIHHELKKIAHVTVVAPDTQKSSISHAITLAHPIWSRKVKRNGKFFGYSVSGTPADCVKFGVSVLMKRKPDVIISGINLGSNDGCSVFYSGTVAGAREGALLGIPSAAISLNTFVDPDFSYAAKCSRLLVKKYINNSLPKGTFLNINIPNLPKSKIKGIRLSSQGLVPIHGRFKKRSGPNDESYYWMDGKYPAKRKNMQIDTYALNHGYVTVTPIQSDSTDHNYLSQFDNWDLGK